MSAFEEAVIQRIKQLEREVERLQRWERAADLGLGKLTDPNADRVLFWDESAVALQWLQVDGIVDTAFGQWQSWTPTLTGWSGAPTVVARYTIIGKICFFWIFVSGTSNSSDAYLTLPVTASNITNGAWGGANLRADNNGTTLTAASRWIIPADNPTIIRFNTNMSSGAWDTSGIKRIQVIGFYEMA